MKSFQVNFARGIAHDSIAQLDKEHGRSHNAGIKAASHLQSISWHGKPKALEELCIANPYFMRGLLVIDRADVKGQMRKSRTGQFFGNQGKAPSCMDPARPSVLLCCLVPFLSGQSTQAQAHLATRKDICSFSRSTRGVILRNNKYLDLTLLRLRTHGPSGQGPVHRQMTHLVPAAEFSGPEN